MNVLLQIVGPALMAPMGIVFFGWVTGIIIWLIENVTNAPILGGDMNSLGVVILGMIIGYFATFSVVLYFVTPKEERGLGLAIAIITGSLVWGIITSRPIMDGQISLLYSFLHTTLTVAVLQIIRNFKRQ